MEKWEGSQLNEAKDILAYELTKLVHGEEEASKARDTSKALFSGAISADNMPEAAIADEDFRDGKVDILTLLVSSGLTTSRGEARRAVQQNGVSVNDEKVTDPFTAYDKSAFDTDFVLKKGKKNFCKIVVK